MLKTKLWGILALILVFGLALTGCEQINDTISKITGSITWMLSQEGSTGGTNPQGTTTHIVITFNSEVSNLLPTEVEIAGDEVIVGSGAWVQEGNAWKIPVTVTGTEYASVKVTRPGVLPGTKTVKVFIAGAPGPTGYTAVADGGETASTTKITLTFEEAVSTLMINDITLSPTLSLSTGTATKETLNKIGDGITWTLNISVITPGDMTVAILNVSGISKTFRTVTVYKVTANTLTITGLNDYSGKDIRVGLFDTKAAIGADPMNPSVNGEGTISSLGSVKLDLHNDNNASWAGTGNKYVGIVIMNGENLPIVRVSKNTANFTSTSKNPSIVYSTANFEKYAFKYTFDGVSQMMEITPNYGSAGIDLDDWLGLMETGLNYVTWVSMFDTQMYTTDKLNTTYNGANKIKAADIFYLEVPIELLME